MTDHQRDLAASLTRQIGEALDIGELPDHERLYVIATTDTTLVPLRRTGTRIGFTGESILTLKSEAQATLTAQRFTKSLRAAGSAVTVAALRYHDWLGPYMTGLESLRKALDTRPSA